jgi:hypothetical protein
MGSTEGCTEGETLGEVEREADSESEALEPYDTEREALGERLAAREGEAVRLAVREGDCDLLAPYETDGEDVRVLLAATSFWQQAGMVNTPHALVGTSFSVPPAYTMATISPQLPALLGSTLAHSERCILRK